MINEQVLDQFERDVTAYRAGQISEERFPAIRLQQGIYAQRQDGYFMVRSKLPGGLLKPGQLAGYAAILQTYSRQGHGVVHITTRQDIQFHYIELEHLATLVRELARYGVTTRESSGNTIRNITSCPLAGVCTREHVDVRPYLDATVRHFLGHPLTQQLPRKFKISFSGCEADCAQGMINDLGVVATRNTAGEPGFMLLAFGGLGAKPHQALTLDEFVAEKELLPAVEAVVTLHHRHSDRSRRSHSRIKFLVQKFGVERLVEMYREAFARIRAGTPPGAPHTEWRQPGTGPVCKGGVVSETTAQRQPGLYSVPVHVPFGRLNAEQLRGLSQLLPRLALDEVRTTQNQNLLIPNVPSGQLQALRQGLKTLGLSEPRAGDDVVACPGTALCPLAIVASPDLGREVDGGEHGLRIRINGCQNKCAQSDTGDIGLFGQARRHHGKLVPSYTLQLGGNGLSHGGFGLKGPTIPALRAPESVRRLRTAYAESREADDSFRSWALRRGETYFTELLADLTTVTPLELAGVLHDLGSDVAFSVDKIGIGECAGAAVDPIALAEADIAYQRSCRNAFANSGDLEEAHICLGSIAALAVRAAAGVAGIAQADSDRFDPAILREALPAAESLHAAAALLNEQLNAPAGDASRHAELVGRVDAWVAEVLPAARSLQAGPARVLDVERIAGARFTS